MGIQVVLDDVDVLGPYEVQHVVVLALAGKGFLAGGAGCIEGFNAFVAEGMAARKDDGALFVDVEGL